MANSGTIQTAILVIVASGVLNGSFAVPSKRIQCWTWDRIWLTFCFFSQLVLPAGMMMLVAPGVGRVFAQAPVLTLEVAGVGGLWGTGALLFGLSLKHVGISIANALVSGCVVVLGSTGPLLFHRLGSSGGTILPLLVGLAVLVVAIGLCAIAAVKRSTGVNVVFDRRTSMVGVGFAIAAGCLSSLLNIAFVMGEPLIDQGRSIGLDDGLATLAVWVPALFGGFVPNCIYGYRQLREAGTQSRKQTQAWILTMLMAMFWFGAIVLYGGGARLLGIAGSTYGWAISSGVSMFVSTMWGVASGEWRGTPFGARACMVLSVVLMLGSFITLTQGSVGN